MERGRKAHEELPSDDEVEKFHKTKDKLSLNPAEDEASSDDEEEELDDEAVYNLSASEDSSEEDEEDDEEDDEDDDEDDEDNKSRYAQRRADSWLCRCPSLVMVPADASIHLVDW
jgi:hypothetical protein